MWWKTKNYNAKTLSQNRVLKNTMIHQHKVERERERERDLTQLIWSIRTADFLVHHIHLFTIYVTVENLWWNFQVKEKNYIMSYSWKWQLKPPNMTNETRMGVKSFPETSLGWECVSWDLAQFICKRFFF